MNQHWLKFSKTLELFSFYSTCSPFCVILLLKENFCELNAIPRYLLKPVTQFLLRAKTEYDHESSVDNINVSVGSKSSQNLMSDIKPSVPFATSWISAVYSKGLCHGLPPSSWFPLSLINDNIKHIFTNEAVAKVSQATSHTFGLSIKLTCR